MPLDKRQIAILVEADYQDMEVHYPRYRLIEAGHKVVVVGSGTAGKYFGKYGYPVTVDAEAGQINFDEFAGVIIPGGWAPDKMRLCQPMIDFVRHIDNRRGIVGCICHGGWLLASADIVRGRKLTSYIAIRDDLVNAGAHWTDEEVVVEKNLITSRKPDDLPVFMREILKALEG